MKHIVPKVISIDHAGTAHEKPLKRRSRMEPRMIFTCKNERCTEYEKERPLRYCSLLDSIEDKSGDDDYWLAKLKHCPHCHITGHLEIRHGDKTFSELEGFEEYILGVVKEAILLKKLCDRGVADEGEKAQFQTSITLLSDTKCPCCGKGLLGSLQTE